MTFQLHEKYSFKNTLVGGLIIMSIYGESQRKVKERVYDLLERFESTRNNDKVLLLKYWELYDGLDMNDFAIAFVLGGTSPESITRARRSIQSTGLFPPTAESVLRKRRMLQEEARLHHAAN